MICVNMLRILKVAFNAPPVKWHAGRLPFKRMQVDSASTRAFAMSAENASRNAQPGQLPAT